MAKDGKGGKRAKGGNGGSGGVLSLPAPIAWDDFSHTVQIDNMTKGQKATIRDAMTVNKRGYDLSSFGDRMWTPDMGEDKKYYSDGKIFNKDYYDYHMNCQSCTWAYILNRLGYRVKPNTGTHADLNGYSDRTWLQSIFSGPNGIGVPDLKFGEPSLWHKKSKDWEYLDKRYTEKYITSKVKSTFKNDAVGTLYYCMMDGHAQAMEKTGKDKYTIIDSQINQAWTAQQGIQRNYHTWFQIYRVDSDLGNVRKSMIENMVVRR